MDGPSTGGFYRQFHYRRFHPGGFHCCGGFTLAEVFPLDVSSLGVIPLWNFHHCGGFTIGGWQRFIEYLYFYILIYFRHHVTHVDHKRNITFLACYCCRSQYTLITKQIF